MYYKCFVGEIEPCVTIDYEEKQYYDSGCKEPRCSLCHFTGPVHFMFHGIPKESEIDRQYIFIPQEQVAKTVEMVGYTGNRIEWDDGNEQWVIRDSINYPSKVVAYLNISRTHLPIGRHVWHQKGTLRDPVDKQLPLKLTKVMALIDAK